MTIEEPRKIDFNAIERQSGDVYLIVSDHLNWSEQQGEHLLLLQDKLNSCLSFIESG